MRRGLFLFAAILLVFTGASAAETLVGFKRLILDEKTLRWQQASLSQNATTTVTYAFPTENHAFGARHNCRRMSPLEKLVEASRLDRLEVRREVAAAFEMWEQAANIRFVEIADWKQAGIVIGAQQDPQGYAFADLEPVSASKSNSAVKRSLICLNPAQRWKIGFDGNLSVYDLRFVFAHEIGHAIGLDHPGRSGQLMSYRYDEAFRTLQPGDIRGAVAIYGPPVAGSRGLQSLLRR